MVLTSTTAELNCLDGLTSTTAELNTLDGFNGDVNVLNYAKTLCDTGVTGTEFNCLDGLTSTTAELNFSDGVTSNIQNQVDATVKTTGDQTVAGCKTFTGNTTITGNLSVTGAITCIDTTFSVTSALSVVNEGTGPALVVQQNGSEPIAHFIDKNGDDIFFTDNGGIQTPYLSSGRNTCFSNCVGIGTTSPAQKLHLQDTNGAIIILNSNTGNENNGIFMTEAAAASPYTKGAYVHYDGTNESFKINTGDSTLSTRFTILRDSGNVGIGTTSPNALLNVQGDSDPTILLNAETGNSANSGKLAFAESDGGGLQAWMKYDGSANRLEIGTAEVSQALVVNRTDGKVGIGNTAPAEKLTVSGGISANEGLSAQNIKLPGSSDGYYIGKSGGGPGQTSDLRIGSKTTSNTVALELFHASNPVSLGTNSFNIKPNAAGNDFVITDNSSNVRY
jgi:hypothetical protein